MIRHETISRITEKTYGKTVGRARTKGRAPNQRTYVELDFHEGTSRYELHAGPGWQIVSVMVNTVRFRPGIIGTRTHREKYTSTLSLTADGGYKVLEVIVKQTEQGSALDTEPFVLWEFPAGELS